MLEQLVQSWSVYKDDGSSWAVVVTTRDCIFVSGDGVNLVFRSRGQGIEALKWLTRNNLGYVAERVVASEDNQNSLGAGFYWSQDAATAEVRAALVDAWECADPESVTVLKNVLDSMHVWDVCSYKEFREILERDLNDICFELHWGEGVRGSVLEARRIAKHILGVSNGNAK